MGSFKPLPDRFLADLLGRVAVAVSAGIDMRRAWSSEVARAPRAWRPAVAAVSRGLDGGAGLAEAMRRAGDAFPPLVVGMAEVGDATGHEAETLRDAAAVLADTVRGRRELARRLVWPAFQLAAAIAVVGLLILLAGMIRDGRGQPVDLLGFGLTGPRGLAVFLAAAAPGLVAPAGAVEERLRSGATLAEALHASGRLPARLVEAIEVGEMTGTTAETLARIGDELAAEGRRAFAAAVRGTAFVASAAVAGLIGLVVFRIFSFYLGAIRDAAGGI